MKGKCPIIRVPVADRERVARALFNAGVKRHWCITADDAVKNLQSTPSVFDHIYVSEGYMVFRSDSAPTYTLVNSVEQMIRYLKRTA